MANRADPDQLASWKLLIWFYTVCKGRVYQGSAGPGLTTCQLSCVILCHLQMKWIKGTEELIDEWKERNRIQEKVDDCEETLTYLLS